MKDHYVLAEENGCRVLLDTQLTEDLLQEGQIRELIRTIQETRKKWQLPVEQYISILISADAETKKIIQHYTALLKANVLLNDILFGEVQSGENVIQAKIFDKEFEITFNF